MHERSRRVDDLGLVALPTAITCARLFVTYTLDSWELSSFVLADALVVATELVTLAVEETGVADDVVRWSELEQLNSIVVRLLGFPNHVVIEVWDVANEPMTLPDEELPPFPEGLQLVDITASKWGSHATRRGRVTWAELAVHARTESGLPIRRRKTPPPPAHDDAAAAPTIDDDLLRRVRDGLKAL
jgi:hypothetical protein